MDRRWLPGEDAGEALVAVRKDVVVLVALPGVEEGRHVQAAAVVGVLGHVLREVPLEVNLLVAILQPLLPRCWKNIYEGRLCESLNTFISLQILWTGTAIIPRITANECSTSP